jgi:poly(3-hydroxybutyrate) depolymerase
MRNLLLVCMLVGCGSSGPATGDDDDDVPADGNSGPVTRSAGCGMATSSSPAQFTTRTVGGRDSFVRVPEGYDNERAYPVIYEMHGCSEQREANNVPVENEAGDAAIVVRARALGNCWDTAEAGPDVPYIDAMIADIEGAFCIDTSRRFVTGYSSGSFMTHVLGCIRGDQFRGVASIAGGQPGNNCTGDPAALLIHDENDNTVNISASIGARDNHIERNACTQVTSPTDHPPCVEYNGCISGKEVVWCQTQGQDHSRQDQLAAPIFWSFIESLL